MSNFYTKSLVCNQLLSSNNNYDLIMVYRPDIVADELPNLNNFLLTKDIDKTVFIPNIYIFGHQGYNINDQICITNQKTIEIYLNIYNYIDKYLNEDNILFHPETLLHYHLIKNNININFFEYNYNLNSKRHNIQNT